MATEEQIKELAYAIWEQEGRPEGKHVEHYFRAKQILEEQQEAARVIELGPPRPTVQLAASPPTIELAPPRKRRSFTRHTRHKRR
ncbi:MAG: DUF2934 domain-containing protein [Dehalococcoidales bacterium]|nr:DUF2934 domain-containing protein [Dehalococcoidales bacterium]